MSAPLRVHVADTLDASARESLAAKLSPWAALGPLDQHTQVLVAGQPTRAQLGAPGLRALLLPYAGLLPPTRRHLLAARPELPVFNVHHHATAVAELALTLALCVLRRVVPLDRALRGGDWRPRFGTPCASTLGERTALIVGCGHVGRRLGAALQALGVTVRGTQRRLDRPQVVEGIELHPAGALDDLLPAADLLFVCAPLTPQTTGLLDADRLARLPPGAVLVNVARAQIVDEDALYDALLRHRLGGAGLDVWYDFPHEATDRALTWPAHRPFWQLDNVVLSPHRAGLVRSSAATREAELRAALHRLAHHELPPGRVDVEAGY
ncbi:MAG: hydroxyacid dehydrogenase [Deltaproteobacteria bacterium]|nr:hydroxyacid dehydrogenase [Deltaproteobacteria bacterium]